MDQMTDITSAQKADKTLLKPRYVIDEQGVLSIAKDVDENASVIMEVEGAS